LIDDMATFWASRVTPNNDGSFSINRVISPDEYTSSFKSGVDDSVYTNAAVKEFLYFAVYAMDKLNIRNETTKRALWKKIADNLVILYDSVKDIHPEFKGYNGETIKQADVILLGYPFGFQMPAKTRKNDLVYYTNKTDPGGPAMTASMICIGYLELEDLQTANHYFVKSYQENIQQPFFPFCETTSPSCGANYFITGSGGFLQGVLNGYGGIRIGEQAMTFKFQIPNGVTQMTFQNVMYLGAQITINFSKTMVTFELMNNINTKLILQDSNQTQYPLKYLTKISLKNAGTFSIHQSA